MISIVMPVHNRADLLEYGLKSIRASDYNQANVEVIVVDASSVDNPADVCKKYGAHYLKINPYLSDLPVPQAPHINPGLQQNVGIRMATGDIIILTSPEVVFAKEALSRIEESMHSGISIYGEVFEPTDVNWFHALDGDWSTDTLKELPHGIPYNYDSQGTNKLSAYFLGAFWRENIEKVGGIDEQYVRGIAWEDDDFGVRMASVATPSFRPDIVGVHLPHPRSYQVQERISLNEEIMKAKGYWDIPRAIDNHIKVPNYVANEGRTWGDYKRLVTDVQAIGLLGRVVKLSVQTLDSQ